MEGRGGEGGQEGVQVGEGERCGEVRRGEDEEGGGGGGREVGLWRKFGKLGGEEEEPARGKGRTSSQNGKGARRVLGWGSPHLSLAVDEPLPAPLDQVKRP